MEEKDQTSRIHTQCQCATSLTTPAWIKFNRFRIGVGSFRFNIHKWDLSSCATCECDADDQTANHVFLHCIIHCAPAGIRCLISLCKNIT